MLTIPGHCRNDCKHTITAITVTNTATATATVIDVWVGNVLRCVFRIFLASPIIVESCVTTRRVRLFDLCRSVECRHEASFKMAPKLLFMSALGYWRVDGGVLAFEAISLLLHQIFLFYFFFLLFFLFVRSFHIFNHFSLLTFSLSLSLHLFTPPVFFIPLSFSLFSHCFSSLFFTTQASFVPLNFPLSLIDSPSFSPHSSFSLAVTLLPLPLPSYSFVFSTCVSSLFLLSCLHTLVIPLLPLHWCHDHFLFSVFSLLLFFFTLSVPLSLFHS